MTAAGSIAKYGTLAGLLFGVPLGAFCLIIWPLGTAVAAGAGAGLAFGVFTAIVMAVMQTRMRANRPDFGEAIVREGLANHSKGGEGRGGWLFLTPERLHFKSHGLNMQNEALTIALGEVASVSVGRTLGLIPNRLVVARKDGSRESFVVNGARAWEREIASACAAVAARP